MNILSKLFRSEPVSSEQRLVSCLDTLSQHVGTHWAGVLSNFRSQLPAIFATASIDERYRFLRQLDSLYGGMGSLNDLSLTSAGEQALGELYAAVQAALREAWRGLGREHHATTPSLYPIGFYCPPDSRQHALPGTRR